jgi:branched-chain amino acid transport system ATP-binding protein
LASSLSTGQRRLVELARCLAGPYRILLLDEPSSGLDQHESAQFGGILERVVRERRVGILLVEHDMSLVMRVCSHIYVLDFGVPIFEGIQGPGRLPRRAHRGARGAAGVSADPGTDGVDGAKPAPMGQSSNGSEPPLVLELSDITAQYGKTGVLRDVAIKVRQRSILALIGANGAGKTTLLRVASGLMRPTHGTVRLLGEDVTTQSPNRRVARGLCLIPEGRGIFRSLSVSENLLLQSPKGMREERLERALAAFPVLRNRQRQIAGNLSGGEQQMLALARIYLVDPKVVLLDEVSMGLAPIIISEIFDTLNDLLKTGISIVLVEQFVNRALHMADQVYMINRGRIAFEGRPSDLDERTVLQGYLGADIGTN